MKSKAITPKQTQQLKDAILTIPDYPHKGIMFRDITSLLEDAKAFALCIDLLKTTFENRGFTKIVGTEADWTSELPRPTSTRDKRLAELLRAEHAWRLFVPLRGTWHWQDAGRQRHRERYDSRDASISFATARGSFHQLHAGRDRKRRAL